MSQWQSWVTKHNRTISRQLRPASSVEQAIRDLAMISEPVPDEVEWDSEVQRSDFIRRGEKGRGTLLEFLLAIGDMSIYREFDDRSKAVERLMLELGDQLIDRGAKPTARMLEAALGVGLWNLDGPGRVEAAFRWGAKSAWDPQGALAFCCLRSAWDEKGGEACFAILEREGALKDPRLDFESCSAQRHPIVQAALASDTKTIARLIERGVSVNWRDPETGATLWHVASSISAKVGKALFPALTKSAAGLAGSATLAEVAIPYLYEGELKIRKGQTALHCACDGVRPEALAAALACNAPADMIDARGDSPLTLLSRRWGAKAQAKGEPMAKALLLAGADPGRKDKKGLTPAQSMAAKGPLGALAALLEARPQDVGADDSVAKAAFAKLAERGSEGLARAEDAVMTTAMGGEPKKPSGKKKSL